MNSYARVFLDGARVGEVVFPGGDVDITAACVPGRKQDLAIQVFGRRLDQTYTRLLTPEEGGDRRRGIRRRGLCGDVFLSCAPQGAHIGDVKVDTSVRRWTLTVTAVLEGLQGGQA